MFYHSRVFLDICYKEENMIVFETVHNGPTSLEMDCCLQNLNEEGMAEKNTK